MSEDGLKPKPKPDLQATKGILPADSPTDDPDEITDASPLVRQALREELPPELAEHARVLEEKILDFRKQLAIFGVSLGPDRTHRPAEHPISDVDAGLDEATRILLRAAEQEYADAVIARSAASTPETRERCSRALQNWDRIRNSGHSRFS
jgi:hypothetical protein